MEDLIEDDGISLLLRTIREMKKKAVLGPLEVDEDRDGCARLAVGFESIDAALRSRSSEVMAF